MWTRVVGGCCFVVGLVDVEASSKPLLHSSTSSGVLSTTKWPLRLEKARESTEFTLERYLELTSREIRQYSERNMQCYNEYYVLYPRLLPTYLAYHKKQETKAFFESFESKYAPLSRGIWYSLLLGDLLLNSAMDFTAVFTRWRIK